jgi:hypothetical protein
LAVENINPENLSAEQKKLFAEFNHHTAVQTGPKTLTLNQRDLPKINEVLLSHGVFLSPQVKIKAYGQHAGNCVDRVAGEVIFQLKKKNPHTKFGLRVITTPSELANHAREQQLLRMIQKRRPALLKEPGAKVLLKMFADAEISAASVRAQLEKIKSLREIKQPRRRMGRK